MLVNKNLNTKHLLPRALAALKVSCILGCISKCSQQCLMLLRWHLEYVTLGTGASTPEVQHQDD